MVDIKMEKDRILDTIKEWLEEQSAQQIDISKAYEEHLISGIVKGQFIGMTLFVNYEGVLRLEFWHNCHLQREIKQLLIRYNVID